MKRWEEGEKLLSKNSEFMGRAGKDKVGEIRKEIEGKKRRDRDTEIKKVESNKEMMRWDERQSVGVCWCVLALFKIPAAVFIKVSEF